MSDTKFNCESTDVAELFSCLFPVEVEVAPAEESDHSSSDKVLAVYRDDDGGLAAVCKTDFEFAARAAAALTMIPTAGCEDTIASKVLSENYVDNTHEVMNLVCTLLSLPNGRRVFLSDLVTPGQAVPDDVNDMCEGHQFSATMRTTFGNYGDGVISFYG